MEPTLYHGDLVITVNKPANEIVASHINGDIVVVNKGSDCYVEYGGAALFYDSPRTHNIIHRVVDKKFINQTWFFLTKGDNNIYCDGGIRELFKASSGNYTLYQYNASDLVYIPQSEILGVMIFRIPFLGFLKDLTWFILIPVIIIICLLLILDQLEWRLILTKEETKKKVYQSKVLIILILLVISHLFLYFSISQFYFMNNQSMEPHLNYNDLLLIETCPASQIEVGDTCIIRSPEYFYSHGFDPLWWNFYPNSSHIVHRILDKRNVNGTWYFMTGGDKSSIHIDGMLYTIKKSENYLLIEYNRSNIIYIPENEILGVVRANIPLIGFIIELTPYISGFFIALIVIVFILLKSNRKIRLSKKFC